MSVCIFIPVYKQHPSDLELKSFSQAQKIFGGTYDICVVCPSTLSLSEYQRSLKCSIAIKRLDDSLFTSTHTYSRMMMSSTLYQMFSCYDYILVYQLDCWAFRDELSIWTSKGYDYVGAPWFEGFNHGNSLNFKAVGNGGFSLRKVKTFIELCKLVTSKCKVPVEDNFFCLQLDKSLLSRPSCLEAAEFAFECHPSYLYSLTHKLPMGCHAFQHYEYDNFWLKHAPELK